MMTYFLVHVIPFICFVNDGLFYEDDVRILFAIQKVN